MVFFIVKMVLSPPAAKAKIVAMVGKIAEKEESPPDVEDFHKEYYPEIFIGLVDAAISGILREIDTLKTRSSKEIAQCP